MQNSAIATSTNAIKELRSLLLCKGSGEAVGFLQQLYEGISFHLIYQHFFPEEYAQSAHKDNWERKDEFIYSELETEVIHLIDERLFPLPDCIAAELEYSLAIPVYRPYPDYWDWDSIENLFLAIQLGLCFLSPLHTQYELLDKGLIQDCQHLIKSDEDYYFDADIFVDICVEAAESDQVLLNLPLTFACLQYSTHNVWIDTCCDEASIEFPWTIESIQTLKNEWLEFLEIENKLQELSKWLLDKSNLQKAATLWSQAFVSNDEQNLNDVLSPY